ncbi:MAG: TIR domain-containing protein, partial [Pseudomonadota bacterium]
MDTPDTAQEKLKVFVSYSRADVAFADQLVALLTDKGFEPLIDRHDIDPAEKWKTRLGDLIFSCDKVVFVLTETSAGSPVCRWEVDEAERLGKPMIPITIGPLAGVEAPPQLGDLNYIYFYADPATPGSGFYSGSQQLTAALRTDLAWTRQRTRLMEQAQRHGGNPVDALLLRGEVLAGALEWAARTPKGETVPPKVAGFIEASEAHEARLKAAAEADLAEREAALRRAEEAVETEQAALKKAERAQRGARRATWIGLAAAIALALIGGLATWYATDRALDAQTLRSQLFAGESARFGERGDPVRSMLLALLGNPNAESRLVLERFRRDENPAARTALAHAATHNRLLDTVEMDSPVYALAIHATDPALFVTGHSDSTAKLWRIGEDAPLQTFEGHR